MNTHVAQTQVTRATCPYCGTGCGVLIETQQGRITGVQGDPDHPANFGRLCTKGSTTADMLLAPGRLTTALRRDDRTADLAPVPVDAEISRIAERLAALYRRQLEGRA